MAGGQVFRIEIPVEVTSKADVGQLQRVQTVIQQTENALKKILSTGDSAFQKIASGASSAASSLHQMDSAADQSSNAIEQIGDSADEIGDAADDAADSVEDIGDAAKSAGNSAKGAFDGAAQSADKFGQRMEKSQKSLRQMFKEKLKMVLEAVDKISPIVKDIMAKAKSFAGKVWRVTLKAVDLVTAPFRALKNMIMSPIMVTLSIAGIGLGASSFYQTFTEFTSGMSNVKALSGATDTEFKQLTETAKQLGATTKFTAAEASEGMQYLAMAGWETKDIIDAMPGLLQLAAAGATDLGTASDIVSDVMTAMGMSANEATRAADVFARTATSTNTTVSMLGETLKYAAPIAHSFGLELEEVATITGMMANAGIKGSQAGTTIRSALMRLASPPAEAAKAMSKLGLSFSDSTGKMKDMGTIMKDLSEAFSGLSEQEKLAYADDIFGKNAASGWLAAIEQGSDAYDSLYESIKNSKGAAQEMADIQLDNLAGDVTLLQSAVDGMKITLMDKINPFLRQGVQWVTSKIPEITEAIGNLVDKGIEKAGELKDRISEVFNSQEMQNADSLGEKLFIAWDKVIAEPFEAWWNGNGKGFVLDILGKVGKTFGEVLHGAIAGIFAAIKGEEIDVEGFNLTGIAKAGAEAAKQYLSSFMEGLNAGGLMGSMPGFLKAGLVGFGAMKLGSGALGIVRTIGQLRLAFGGVAIAGSAAATATTEVAGAAAAASASAAGGASAFTGLGSALAAIPGWGWAALAVLTAVGIGLKLYNDNQERQRQSLMRMSDEVNEAADNYVNAAKKAQEVRGTFDQIAEIKLKIEEGGKNEETVKKVRDEIDEITDRTVWLEARLANTSLTPEKIDEYKAELEKIKDRKAYLEAALAEGTLTSAQVDAYQKELEKLKGKEAELKAALAEGTLTKTEVAKYQDELDALQGKTVELKATLIKEGYSVAEVAMIEAQLAAFQEGQKKATVMIANNSDLTPDQITDYVTRLGEIATAKAEAEVKIEGAGLTPDQISKYSDELKKIEGAKAKIEVQMAEGEGSMSPEKWQELVSQYTNLTNEEAKIKLLIDGSQLDETQLTELQGKVEKLKADASSILLQIADNSDLSEDEMKELAQLFQDFGDMNVLLNFGLSAGSLTKEDLEQYNQQLKELYGNISELTGGAFTPEDLESGAVSQQQVEEYVIADAGRKREALALEVDRAKAQLPEATAARDQYEQQYRAKEQDVTQASEAKAKLQTMQADLDTLKLQDQRRFEDAQRSGNWDDYNNWREQTYDPGIAGMQQKYQDEVSPLLGTSEGYNMTQTDMSYRDLDELDGFAGAIGDLEDYIADESKKRDQYKSDYETQNQALNDLYKGEKGLVEADAFGQDARYAGNSLEEMAAQYSQLDEAGKQMFANAMAGLDELNQQADYITDAEKTSTAEIAEMAVKSVEQQASVDTINDIQGRLSDMSNTYSQLSDAGKEAWNTGDLERLNSELTDLNLEPLESLDTANMEALQGVLTALGSDIDLSSMTDMGEAIQTVMDTISGMDTEAIEALDFSTLADSLDSLGGNSETLRSNVEEVKTAMDELAGVTVDSASTSVDALGTSATDTAANVETAKAAMDTLDGATASGAASSVSSVGSAASSAASAVSGVSSEVEALDGKKAYVDIYIRKHGDANVEVPHATGGIFNTAHVGLVAEDGPEAIIPLGMKRRDRGLDLWREAGRMLGVHEYAEGGILGPTAEALAKLPDGVWSDDGDGSGDYKPNGGTGGGNVVQVSVEVSPEYKIDGANGDAEAILDTIRAHQNELAELLGAAMADQLEDIVSNM